MAEAQNPKAVKENVLQIIKQTPPQQIAELAFVRERFIKNYNACNPKKGGDLMYHRQVIFFNQQINSDANLQGVDPFSLYACFVTAAAKDYSLDPADNEVYLLALKGKAVLWRQAGAHVKRLIQSGQIVGAEQAKLVYTSDIFKVEDGKVIKHVEEFVDDDGIKAAYIKMILPGNKEKFFIYRKSDWLEWKKKSGAPNGPNWNADGKGTPNPGFLRTKVVKHACQEKCWAIGTAPVADAEVFQIEVDDDDQDLNNNSGFERSLPVNTNPTTINLKANETPVNESDLDKPATDTKEATVTLDDENF